MANFIQRMIRAARLDVALYEEVEADRSALGQALAVVALSSLAAGIGSIGRFGSVNHIVLVILGALGGWFVWAVLVYWIGARLLPEPQTRSDLGELLRTIGFATAPGLIRVLGVFPGVGGVVFAVAAIWMLVAVIIAVRQALDYTSTLRAIGVCAIGWLVQAVLLLLAIGVAARGSGD